MWPALAVGAYVAGNILQTYGQMQNIDAQIEAAKKNAAFYKEQARWAKASAERQVGISARQFSNFLGVEAINLVSSGQSLRKLAVDASFANAELQAIRIKGDQEARLALLKGESEMAQANAAESSKGNLLLGNLLGTAGGAFGFMKTRPEVG